MIIKNLEDSQVVDLAGAEGITKHIVIGPDDGCNDTDGDAAALHCRR